MTYQHLNHRLNTLIEAERSTVQLINRLSRLAANIGSGASSGADGDARVELSSEIHQNLKEQAEALELLRQEIEDCFSSSVPSDPERRVKGIDREGDRATLVAQVSRLGEDLEQARAHFRKAQLQAKRNAETAKRKERELLFAGAQQDNGTISTSRKRQDKLSQDQLLVSASSDVTAALRRTHQLMQSELSRSQFAHDTLQESTAALSSLSESYSNLDTLLSSSRTLVSSLLRSQKSDTWYLETAFWILVVTISWLFFRRILYGPLWWTVWLPVKLLYRFSYSIFASLGLLRSQAGVKSAESPASTSLILKPSATGGFHKFGMANQAPFVAVGGGGRGGGAPSASRSSQHDKVTVLEDVGNMAEGTLEKQRDKQGLSSQDEKDLPEENMARNPKKRMWEENTEGVGKESSAKDEL